MSTTEPALNGHTPAGTSDALIESALDFLSSEGPSNDNAGKPPKQQPPKPKRPEKHEPDDDEGDDPVPDQDAPEQEAEDDGEGEAAQEHTRGSKEDPFTVKDLPKDKFIELKVDGERTTVSLSELADGYIRQNTFSARINKTKALADEAQSMVQRAQHQQQRLQSEFRDWVGDEKQIYEFFMGSEERERVFARAAERYALLLRHFREQPEEQLRWQRARDQQRLQKEREHWQAEQRAELEAKQKKEASERAMRILKPGWEEGLRRAGFPKPTRELYDEVMLRCNMRVQQGGQVTSDDVATFVERAAKLLELPKGNDKPKAPPPPKPKAEASKKNGGNLWDAMPAHQRRKSPDYFLRNLRTKDFR